MKLNFGWGRWLIWIVPTFYFVVGVIFSGYHPMVVGYCIGAIVTFAVDDLCMRRMNRGVIKALRDAVDDLIDHPWKLERFRQEREELRMAAEKQGVPPP